MLTEFFSDFGSSPMNQQRHQIPKEVAELGQYRLGFVVML